MKVITIESEVYKNIVNKLDVILQTIKDSQEREKERAKNEPTILPNDKIETLYNDLEVAGLLDISTRTLARLRKQGGISYIRLSGRIRYRFSDIKHFIDKRKIKTKDEINKKVMPLSKRVVNN